MFIPKAISKRRRHQLGANVATFYVIKITTPRTPHVTRIENILRESVQSTVGSLKLHLFRYFKNINLLLFNSEHILRIMYITKSQTIRGVIVTLNPTQDMLPWLAVSGHKPYTNICKGVTATEWLIWRKTPRCPCMLRLWVSRDSKKRSPFCKPVIGSDHRAGPGETH